MLDDVILTSRAYSSLLKRFKLLSGLDSKRVKYAQLLRLRYIDLPFAYAIKMKVFFSLNDFFTEFFRTINFSHPLLSHYYSSESVESDVNTSLFKIFESYYIDFRKLIDSCSELDDFSSYTELSDIACENEDLFSEFLINLGDIHSYIKSDYKIQASLFNDNPNAYFMLLNFKDFLLKYQESISSNDFFDIEFHESNLKRSIKDVQYSDSFLSMLNKITSDISELMAGINYINFQNTKRNDIFNAHYNSKPPPKEIYL